MAVLEKILHGLKYCGYPAYYTSLAFRIFVGYIVETLIDMHTGTSLRTPWAICFKEFVFMKLWVWFKLHSTSHTDCGFCFLCNVRNLWSCDKNDHIEDVSIFPEGIRS